MPDCEIPSKCWPAGLLPQSAEIWCISDNLVRDLVFLFAFLSLFFSCLIPLITADLILGESGETSFLLDNSKLDFLLSIYQNDCLILQNHLQKSNCHSELTDYHRPASKDNCSIFIGMDFVFLQGGRFAVIFETNTPLPI